MTIIKIIALIGVAAMTVVIATGFFIGDFNREGTVLLSMPWGIVSMVDLYTGFTLFSCWIAYREKSMVRSIIWIFFMMTLGFFTGSVYMLYALTQSKGDWKKFWMGERAY